MDMEEPTDEIYEEFNLKRDPSKSKVKTKINPKQHISVAKTIRAQTYYTVTSNYDIYASSNKKEKAKIKWSGVNSETQSAVFKAPENHETSQQLDLVKPTTEASGEMIIKIPRMIKSKLFKTKPVDSTVNSNLLPIVGVDEVIPAAETVEQPACQPLPMVSVESPLLISGSIADETVEQSVPVPILDVTVENIVGDTVPADSAEKPISEDSISSPTIVFEDPLSTLHQQSRDILPLPEVKSDAIIPSETLETASPVKEMDYQLTNVADHQSSLANEVLTETSTELEVTITNENAPEIAVNESIISGEVTEKNRKRNAVINSPDETKNNKIPKMTLSDKIPMDMDLLSRLAEKIPSFTSYISLENNGWQSQRIPSSSTKYVPKAVIQKDVMILRCGKIGKNGNECQAVISKDTGICTVYEENGDSNWVRKK